MHSLEVHSNESTCRKSGCLGLEQVYIKAPWGEKVYTILRPEFGPDKGKLDVIVRAL